MKEHAGPHPRDGDPPEEARKAPPRTPCDEPREPTRSRPLAPRVPPFLPYFALVTLLVVLAPSTLHAQFGRLREMVGGGEKGKVYGIDVTQTPEVVFVVDFSVPFDFSAEQRGQLREYLAQEATQYTQQQLMEKGGDYAAMMAGPVGAIAKTAIEKRRDKVGTARRHVKSAIDGLEEGQRFGLITFEGDAQLWHVDLVQATKDNRKEAQEIVERAQGGEDEGGLLGFGVSTLRESLLAASGLALQQEMIAAGAAAQGTAVPGGTATSTAGSPPPSAAFAPSPGALLRGIVEAIEMRPDAIVLVVGAPPPGVDGEALLTEVTEKNEGKVVIHVAEFGSDEGSALYRALAEQNGGRHVHP